MAVLRISAKTNLLITTKAITGMLHKRKYAEVQALGRFSILRAEQAIGRAATLLEMQGIKIAYKIQPVASYPTALDPYYGKRKRKSQRRVPLAGWVCPAR